MGRPVFSASDPILVANCSLSSSSYLHLACLTPLSVNGYRFQYYCLLRLVAVFLTLIRLPSSIISNLPRPSASAIPLSYNNLTIQSLHRKRLSSCCLTRPKRCGPIVLARNHNHSLTSVVPPRILERGSNPRRRNPSYELSGWKRKKKRRNYGNCTAWIPCPCQRECVCLFVCLPDVCARRPRRRQNWLDWTYYTGCERLEGILLARSIGNIVRREDNLPAALLPVIPDSRPFLQPLPPSRPDSHSIWFQTWRSTIARK